MGFCVSDGRLGRAAGSRGGRGGLTSGWSGHPGPAAGMDPIIYGTERGASSDGSQKRKAAFGRLGTAKFAVRSYPQRPKNGALRPQYGA